MHLAFIVQTKISRNLSFTRIYYEFLLCTRHSMEIQPTNKTSLGLGLENGVKACKRHLKRIVGESSLTFEEMRTVLC